MWEEIKQILNVFDHCCMIRSESIFWKSLSITEIDFQAFPEKLFSGLLKRNIYTKTESFQNTIVPHNKTQKCNKEQRGSSKKLVHISLRTTEPSSFIIKPAYTFYFDGKKTWSSLSLLCTIAFCNKYHKYFSGKIRIQSRNTWQ